MLDLLSLMDFTTNRLIGLNSNFNECWDEHEMNI